MWNDVKNQDGLDVLLETYGGFHDSCIKEIHYISGAYVTENLYMQPMNNLNSLRIVFQRQYLNPMEIEVEFNGLVKLNLEPANTSYTCEILDVSFFFENDMVYWGDSFLFETQRNEYAGIWLQAAEVRWRIVK